MTPDKAPYNIALLNAAQTGDLKAAVTALKEGADINYTDHDGNTALIIAAKEGHSQIVQRLIDESALLEAQNSDGRTALFEAACNKQTIIVDKLLDKGARRDPVDFEGDTALICATYSGATDAACLLIVRGADIGARDVLGNSALHHAAINGEEKILLLLDKGANFKLKGEGNATPLEMAEEQLRYSTEPHRKKIVQSLKEVMIREQKQQADEHTRKAQAEEKAVTEACRPVLRHDLPVKKPLQFKPKQV